MASIRKCLAFSFAIHAAVLGYFLKNSIPTFPFLSENSDSQYSATFDFEYQSQEKITTDISPIIVSIPEPKINLKKELISYNTIQIKSSLEKQILDISSLSVKQQLKLLETKVNEASSIPKSHLQEIENKLKQEYSIKEREYEPLTEVNPIKERMDYNSVVPYFRIIKKNNINYFQELMVDKNGKFAVNLEKPESEMDFLEKARLTAFQLTPREFRNLATELANKKAEQKEKANEAELLRKIPLINHQK